MVYKPPPICLACDLRPNSGEGRLAILYMQNAFDLKTGSERKQSLFLRNQVMFCSASSTGRPYAGLFSLSVAFGQVIQLHFA